ncbi:outer membrane beta-barrel protein [Bdellovibrio svalbardensis]|uniref:Porin family protein n=1 Tax=Bdellovibrio svalbardensis TaxID=2972972 RepID=A0ABT6DNS8_9BACT|nr:outer membrane beta-barrel protein [Bdellovibrio svalbardensis]MDG0817745.1 porin family protein [Bdellovibrio svalbardensis]
MKFQAYIFLAAVLGTSVASAREFKLSSGPGYTVSPLYGYETVYRDSPTPHLATRAMYGLRVTVGEDILSAEVEYSKASDTENMSTAPEKIYNEDEIAKLGIRSTYRFNNYLHSSLRVGAQATRGIEETTSSGILTRKDKDIRYNPYAGLQLGVSFGVFSLNASSTMVFRDYSDLSKNDIQNTLSFGVGY